MFTAFYLSIIKALFTAFHVSITTAKLTAVYVSISVITAMLLAFYVSIITTLINTPSVNPTPSPPPFSCTLNFRVYLLLYPIVKYMKY